MDEQTRSEIWTLLSEGKQLPPALGLHEKDGRLDLSACSVPAAVPSGKLTYGAWDFAVMGGVTTLKDVRLNALDFSGACLDNLFISDVEMTNCVFDNCSCRNWRVRGTSINNSSFRGTDLRDSSLGGVSDGRANTFVGVDFLSADLRGSFHSCAEYRDCRFKNTRLKKVGFQGSRFVDCTFEGELREVCFNRADTQYNSFPPNYMIRVDFSRAKLRLVEFRELELNDVALPADEDHIILDEYRPTLERLIKVFTADESDLPARQIAAGFRHKLRWAGAKQKRGVLNKLDIQEVGGEDLVRRVEQALRV